MHANTHLHLQHPTAHTHIGALTARIHPCVLLHPQFAATDPSLAGRGARSKGHGAPYFGEHMPGLGEQHWAAAGGGGQQRWAGAAGSGGGQRHVTLRAADCPTLPLPRLLPRNCRALATTPKQSLCLRPPAPTPHRRALPLVHAAVLLPHGLGARLEPAGECACISVCVCQCVCGGGDNQHTWRGVTQLHSPRCTHATYEACNAALAMQLWNAAAASDSGKLNPYTLCNRPSPNQTAPGLTIHCAIAPLPRPGPQRGAGCAAVG